jgi:hypothetical protein
MYLFWGELKIGGKSKILMVCLWGGIFEFFFVLNLCPTLQKKRLHKQVLFKFSQAFVLLIMKSFVFFFHIWVYILFLWRFVFTFEVCLFFRFVCFKSLSRFLNFIYCLVCRMYIHLSRELGICEYSFEGPFETTYETWKSGLQ